MGGGTLSQCRCCVMGEVQIVPPNHVERTTQQRRCAPLLPAADVDRWPTGMTHEELRIGPEPWCGGKRWRCTDIGSRVIVAICVELHEVVEVGPLTEHRGKLQERRYVTDDPSWLDGPPYAVVEHVFDEPSVEGCSLLPEVMGPGGAAVFG